MGNILNSIKNSLQEEVRRDSAGKHFVLFIYLLYSNPLVQALISLIGTVLIAIFIGKNYYGLFFWIVCGFYCLSVVLIALANNHIQEKIKDTAFFQNALLGVSTILRAWATSLQTSAREFQKMNFRTEKNAVKNTLSKIDFQAAALCVCENLHNCLTRNLGSDDIYVTVYQKYMSHGKPYCKMIAHSGYYEPTSYGKEYLIPQFAENLLGNVEFHTYIFASGQKRIRVFADRESVSKAFKLHEGCEDRESCIKQYIGIPISPAKQGITFLLQVDTCVPKLFGKTTSDVEEFAKNMISPFGQFLHMIYEQGRTIHQLMEKLKGGKECEQ